MGHIVLIDDDPDVRETVQYILRGAGPRVTDGLGRGIRALLEGDPADLVITDMIMPEIDGVDVLREVSELPHPPPVLVISGGGKINKVSYLRMAGGLGATDTLAKPFSPAQLLEKVGAILHEHKGTIAPRSTGGLPNAQ